MADISSIDGYVNPWLSSANRSPSQDFADELAKENSKVPSSARSQAKEGSNAQTNVRGQSEAVADQTSPHLTSETDASLNSGMSAAETAALTATLEQLDLVVQPVGVTEALLGSRVFGLHLLASGYLSELAHPESAATEAIFDAVEASQSSMTAREEQVGSNDVARSIGTTSAEDQIPVESVATQSSALDSEASSAATESVKQNAIVEASASTPLTRWLERSLRFTKQADGSAVAWLRDYRMDGNEAAKLVDSLIQEARAKGSVLGRIMLNGREVWTSRGDT